MSPLWQFNLLPDAEGPFPSCFINISEKGSVEIDETYETESARLYDAGFRLWHQGRLLESSKEEISAYKKLQPPTPRDEYRFIKKYWGTKWCCFVFVQRIFSFKNIFKELPAFTASAKAKHENLYAPSGEHDAYKNFTSSLIDENPLVSVIIPTLNRYDMLADSLHDLELQQYKNFEVIIVDQSDNYNEQFYKQFSVNIVLVHQKEKLLWTARNKAIAAAKGNFLLFFDDDSRVGHDWIEEHIKCLDYFNAGISAGVSIAVTGGKVPASYNYFRWADQFDSGNAMVRREVFEQINLFDEKFNNGRMGDGEFGIRAYMHGIRSISNCNASRVHLKAPTGGLRETVSWDAFRPKKIFAPKPVPSVLYLIKKYFPANLQRHYVLQGMMLSNVGYKYKRSPVMMFVSLLLFIIKSPLLYIQYKKSDALAEKLMRGSDATPLLRYRA